MLLNPVLVYRFFIGFCVLFFGLVPAQQTIKHQFIARDNKSNPTKVIMVNEMTGDRWDNPTSDSRGLQLLPNNRVLVSLADGAMELDIATGDTLWEIHIEQSGILSAFRLENGNTLLSKSKKFIEADPQGNIVHTLDHGIPDQRLVWPDTGGNWLVSNAGGKKIFEIDSEGNSLNEWSTLGKSYKALRIPNGNILATEYTNKTIVELDAEGNRVWEAGRVNGKNEDLSINGFSGFDTLPNGNVVVCNWGGSPYLMEFNRENELVWSWEGADIGRITNALVVSSQGYEGSTTIMPVQTGWHLKSISPSVSPIFIHGPQSHHFSINGVLLKKNHPALSFHQL